jgi:hypothetical protein
MSAMKGARILAGLQYCIWSEKNEMRKDMLQGELRQVQESIILDCEHLMSREPIQVYVCMYVCVYVCTVYMVREG